MKAEALRWLVVSLLFSLSASLSYAGGHVESASGDLSSDPLDPTVVALSPGSNAIEGTSGFTSTGFDRDFFTVTIAPGALLSAIVPGPNTQVGGGASFLGLQAGDAITVDPDTVLSGAALLGWHIYSSSDKGTNILDELGSGPDKIGFSGPLPAGTYTFWVQELAPRLFPEDPYPPYPYQFDFTVTAVPEPSTPALMGTGAILLVLALARRGRR